MEVTAECWPCVKHAGSLKHCVGGVEAMVMGQCQHLHSLVCSRLLPLQSLKVPVLTPLTLL